MSASAIQMSIRPGGLSENSKQWLKAVASVLAVGAALFFLSSVVSANDGAEFADAANRFEAWVKGNLGKTAALVALIMGMGYAAFKKDWSGMFGAVILALVVGVIVGIISASFAAVI
jgi:conjugal transfer pilus assembly protein TraA